MKPIFKFISIFLILLNFNLFADCTPENKNDKYLTSSKREFVSSRNEAYTNQLCFNTYRHSNQSFIVVDLIEDYNAGSCGYAGGTYYDHINKAYFYYDVHSENLKAYSVKEVDKCLTECPKGYFMDLESRQCIKECQENEIYNPETKKCEPECEGDMVKNPKTGKCECPEYKDDNYGFYKSVFDKNEKRCKVCAPGTYANKKSGTCNTDCSGLPSAIDLMDCACQLKSKGGFRRVGINPKELASIFEPSFYPYFGDVCYFACEKPGSAIEVRSKKTPNFYKTICVDLKNSKKDIPINPYPGNDDENPNEEKINPDNYTVVDVSDIPENVINDLLNKVKDEIDKNPGKTTTEKQDNITVTKGNDIDIEKIKNKKGDGLTQKITYPKPGVTVIEHEDGSVDLIFDGKKMKKSDKPGKTPPGGGTGKTDDNKSSGDGGNSDNSGGSTNITNNLNIKDYSKDLKSIVDILKDIERNTAKTANNSLNGNLDTGDTSKIPSGEGELDGITDSLGNYDFEGEISKAMGYFDNVEKSAKDLLSLIKGDGIPSIKKTNSPTSCPITRSFISPTINEEITWDICKVLYPHKEAYYILFYLSFMVTFIIACYKLLIFLFVSFR
ncbi:hypothetical protein [Campylobacter ureolyticus]|uniref:hypothetical protein n=1 Tax=Campylobacter ureolyticus TaxID=827 RepID=UPI0022B526FE|nr:hypothetical protein [Campylobacter ureolyticus]MCZ6157807.1 hypothetical protein [Campylobacter ureolyticus]